MADPDRRFVTVSCPVCNPELLMRNQLVSLCNEHENERERNQPKASKRERMRTAIESLLHHCDLRSLQTSAGCAVMASDILDGIEAIEREEPPGPEGCPACVNAHANHKFNVDELFKGVWAAQGDDE